MKSIKMRKNLFYVLAFVIIECLFLKVFMYDILPAKYFFDALHILGVMTGTAHADTGYAYTADIFNKINFLGLTNIQQWGYLVAIIFMPILIYIIARKKEYNSWQLIFIIASFTLLDIYVLGLSKDIIQFVYFFVIYLILSSKKMGNIKKIIFSCAVLLYEAVNFRVYYAIMAMLIVSIYVIYEIFIKNKNLSKKQFAKIIFLSMCVFFVEVFIVQIISTENYNSILRARSSVNMWRTGSENANTIINDVLGVNTNYIKFIGNYLINTIRLMFPVELVIKGPVQIAFCLYQIFITLNIIGSCRKMNESNCLWIITIISFFMVSIIFEPDFGSFVRHESALILIILEITRINFKANKESSNNV